MNAPRLLPFLPAALSLGCLGQPLILPPPRTAVPVASTAPTTTQLARARIIGDTGELVAGDLAEGALGDVRIDNAYLAFVIDRIDAPHGFADSGGQIIDAVPLITDGRDRLRALGTAVGDGFGRQPVNERLELVRGQREAIVRAVGHDPSDADVQIVTEYRLGDDAHALEIVTRVTAGAKPLHQLAVGDSIVWGQSERFVPGTGLWANQPVAPLVTDAGYFLGVGPDGRSGSYAYVVPTGPLSSLHGVGWSTTQVQRIDLLPRASAEVRRWLFVAAAVDGDLLDGIARTRRTTVARAEGRVLEESSGHAVPGARVVLEDAAGAPMALAQATADGYAIVAPPGNYAARVVTADRRSADRVDVELRPERPAVLDLLVSAPGRLRYSVREGADGDPASKPSPAKLTFLVDNQPAMLGPAFANPGGAAVVSASGSGVLSLAPGHYRVVASRGPAFTLASREIDVRANEESRADFRLRRVVDWPKVVCGDPHEHALPSADSAVALADRAADNLAEGLDVLVATDHDQVTDYRAAVAQLGAAAPLALLAGEEATRNGLGHWNAYPLPIDAKIDATVGATALRTLSGPGVVAALRGAGARVVQLNHPRAGTIGFFNTAHFDAHAPVPVGFATGLDALEVWNGKTPAAFDQVLSDWFALLSAGRPLTAVSGSDAHVIYGQEVGWPRTCVVSAGAVTDVGEAFVRGVTHQAAFMTNGPYVKATIEGRTFGQVAPAPRGHARLDAEVWAAPFVDVATVEVWVGGQRRGRPIVVPPGTAPLRWRGAIDLHVDGDSFVVLIVRGKQTLEPVVSRLAGEAMPLPLAVTNPIYLDRDSDGKFTLQRR